MRSRSRVGLLVGILAAGAAAAAAVMFSMKTNDSELAPASATTPTPTPTIPTPTVPGRLSPSAIGAPIEPRSPAFAGSLHLGPVAPVPPPVEPAPPLTAPAATGSNAGSNVSEPAPITKPVATKRTTNRRL